MCTDECNHTQFSYERLYSEAYYATNRETWLLRTIQSLETSCPRRRNYTLKYLLQAVKTQSIFANIKPATHEKLKNAHSKHAQKTFSCIRKIQLKMLSHIYRPHGSMYRAGLKELSTLLEKNATPDANVETES